MTDENTRPPFDENAALEELERLREEIRQVRSRREQKVEEFEAWVRETRTASRAERVAELEQSRSDAPAPAAAAARSASRGAESTNQSSVSAAGPATVAPPAWMPLEDERTDEPRPKTVDHFRSRRAYYAAGAAAVLIGGALLTRTLVSDRSEPPTNLAAEPSMPQPVEPAPSPAQKPPVQPPAADRRALEIEMTTIRPVWMRVTVDGERRLEREVAAGQRLTFGADRSIVIRAGDGGGVRLSIDGRDQGLLGRDGQIAVRALTPK